MSNEVRFYTPGDNCNLLTIRKESNFDPSMNPGNGDCLDIQASAEKLYKLVANQRGIISAMQGALDALSQNKTFPADIEQAKRRLADGLKLIREA